MNFLGLDSRQWIDIGISAIVLVVVPTLGRKIVNKWLIRLIQTIVGRTETKLDDALLPAARTPLYWLVIAATSHWAILRLTFLSFTLVPFWTQFFFVAYLGLSVVLLWRSVSAFFCLVHTTHNQNFRSKTIDSSSTFATKSNTRDYWWYSNNYPFGTL